ncbi:hypothetical protein D9611_011994 [Ephemerocybe angulata]|uniref:Uncharacterized protein n=1 Tax=Ephemerocybe angulata TaxID=980116 RepID=A0A8H5FEZ6_9AGAR|nr:hypothetical protein D9611_011994 [Tulosesus angulatus]
MPRISLTKDDALRLLTKAETLKSAANDLFDAVQDILGDVGDSEQELSDVDNSSIRDDSRGDATRERPRQYTDLLSHLSTFLPALLPQPTPGHGPRAPGGQNATTTRLSPSTASSSSSDGRDATHPIPYRSQAPSLLSPLLVPGAESVHFPETPSPPAHTRDLPYPTSPRNNALQREALHFRPPKTDATGRPHPYAQTRSRRLGRKAAGHINDLFKFKEGDPEDEPFFPPGLHSSVDTPLSPHMGDGNPYIDPHTPVAASSSALHPAARQDLLPSPDWTPDGAAEVRKQRAKRTRAEYDGGHDAVEEGPARGKKERKVERVPGDLKEEDEMPLILSAESGGA